MSYLVYEKAKKLGDKAYREAVSHGRSPYLPVLDEMVSREQIRGEVNLGLVDIPLDRVVGTATSGRTTAFAQNFMPILDMKSEFGAKWTRLCEAQMTEGIRDAIQVYEYLNYFYVVEGNKRVSVLKYFGADSIPAMVIRKVPKLTEDPEIRKYYAFMDFYKKTGINYIWFSREAGFRSFLEVVGDGEDTFLTVKSLYYRYRKLFLEKGGARLQNITPGDAFLVALRIHSLEKLDEMSTDEMKDCIASLWQEYQLLNNDEETVEVALDPPEEKKNLFNVIFPAYSASKPLTVVFLFDRDPSVSDWIFGHELGRTHVKEVFGDVVRTLKVIVDETGEEALRVMEDMIEKEGADVIFTTTASYIEASLKCAVNHPEVKILNCSINTSHRYMRTYSARLFEAKFLSGMVAGALSREGKLAYLADFPIFGVTAEINAFALGARMVRPDATVRLCWTTLKEGSLRSEISKELIKEGVDFVSDQDMLAPIRASRKFGLYRLGEGDPVNFAMPVYNWGVLYEHIVRMILSGAWDDADASDASRAINYWWGLSAGVIDLILSEKVPAETKRLVNFIREAIIKDRLHPFEGPIKNSEGELVCPEGEMLSADDIIRMDWLAENVIGSFPPLSAFKETAQALVEIKGVKKTEKGGNDEDTGNS